MKAIVCDSQGNKLAEFVGDDAEGQAAAFIITLPVLDTNGYWIDSCVLEEGAHCDDCGCVVEDAHECAKCGISDKLDMTSGLCEWCRADEQGSPWGRCVFCDGARAKDGSCACKTANGKYR